MKRNHWLGNRSSCGILCLQEQLKTHFQVYCGTSLLHLNVGYENWMKTTKKICALSLKSKYVMKICENKSNKKHPYCVLKH